MSGLTNIKTFATYEEAQIVTGFLRAHGVGAALPDHSSLTTMPHYQIALGGFRVLVPHAQVPQALELLTEARAPILLSEPEPACAQCGARAFKTLKIRHWLISIALLIGLGAFFPIIRKTDKLECAVCGARITRDEYLAMETQ